MNPKIKKKFYDEYLKRNKKPPSGEAMREFSARFKEVSGGAPPAEGRPSKEFMDSPFMKPVEEWEKRDRDGSRGKWRYFGTGRFKDR